MKKGLRNLAKKRLNTRNRMKKTGLVMYIMSRIRRTEWMTIPVAPYSNKIIAVSENKDSLIKLLDEIKAHIKDINKQTTNVSYSQYEPDYNTETDLYFRCMKFNIRDSYKEVSARIVYEFHIHEANVEPEEISLDVIESVIDGNFVIIK